MHRILVIVVSIVALSALISCDHSKTQQVAETNSSPVKTQVSGEGPEAVKVPSNPGAANATNASGERFGVVKETMDAGGYTYVQVEVNGTALWAAGPLTKVAVGQTVSLPAGAVMQNFFSPTLERTFESIDFVPAITVATDGATAPADAMPKDANHAGVAEIPAEAVDGAQARTVAPAEKIEGIEKPEGGKAIADCYTELETLKDSGVTVRGKVVKFNANILGTNWIHIQDGSGDATANTHDLTVTTKAVVAVGDVVTLKGTLGKDKNFGAGYQYAVIVENAELVE